MDYNSSLTSSPFDYRKVLFPLLTSCDACGIKKKKNTSLNKDQTSFRGHMTPLFSLWPNTTVNLRPWSPDKTIYMNQPMSL